VIGSLSSIREDVDYESHYYGAYTVQVGMGPDSSPVDLLVGVETGDEV